MLPPERANFYKRPVVVVLRNENLARSTPKHWCAVASHDWQVLPEHYAICRTCNELPPCRNGEHGWDSDPQQAPHSGRSALTVPPGCCIGCAEPVNPRMRTVCFPGPNLWYPDLGDDSAVFHTRTACADKVESYRRQWMAEGSPGAPQQTLTLCPPRAESFVLPRTRRSTYSAEPADDTPTDDWSALSQADLETSPLSPSVTRPKPPANARPSMDPASPALPANPVSPASSAAPAVDTDAVRRLTEDLDASLGARPVFHNAEQAARVIDELTAAVRNIALCLNGTGIRDRS
jgi:hypothetical protein